MKEAGDNPSRSPLKRVVVLAVVTGSRCGHARQNAASKDNTIIDSPYSGTGIRSNRRPLTASARRVTVTIASQDAPVRGVAFAITTTLSGFLAILCGYLAVGTITWIVNQVDLTQAGNPARPCDPSAQDSARTTP